MKRFIRHIGIANDVWTAREDGTRVRVLCGRRVHPLSPDAAHRLPTCPICDRVAKRRTRLAFTFDFRSAP